MPINAAGAVECPLTVFGSWVTDVPADAVPENISPDNQEIIYRPGGFESRPAFEAVSGIEFPAVNGVTPTGVGGDSFVLPNGIVLNLYLDSAGRVWVENVTSGLGVIILLFQSTPGSYWQSITQFGRQYMALSDGSHGTEVPLQYDGTYVDRVTMDGPGAPPTVSSVPLPAVQMVGSGSNTLTRQNNTVTCQTAAAHGLKVGYQAQIANVPDSNATTVNQSAQSSAQAVNGAYWGLNSGQYRSLFNPGTSPLSAFVASDFGFTIPAGASILGVQVEFGVNSQAVTTGTVAQVALWYSGSQEGTAKSPGTAITTTPTYNTYGSASDLWSAALTPTIVNDPSFGFAVSIDADSIRDFLNFPFTVTVYYTLSGSGTVATVSSIVIKNEVAPGLALVTTTQPHGLIPGINVSLVGVEPATSANLDISAGQWSAGKTTLTTAGSHGLNPGAVIQVQSSTTQGSPASAFSFNGTWTVESVPAPNQLVYTQIPINASDNDVFNATANTGAIYISWPIPSDTPTPTYFEVDSCPTATTFYMPVTYSDGSWSSGTVGFIWEGRFYVTSVVSATEFTYYQPGPNGATTAVGTVTPFGQAAPGLHLCQVLWLTRQGAIPAPSPFTTVIMNGGQYVQVENIPIGPPNVIARILAFTGAQPDVPGELPPFFYIPATPELEGQIVGTSTIINDNVTTSAFLDFSDNTLYAATAISIPGDNLANEIVLDGALAFGSYLDRLLTIGQRNVIQNFLNLGFEGGTLGTNPLGWTVSGAGTLVNTHFGAGWQIPIGSSQQNYGSITQGAYQDIYGDPIVVGNQRYSIRFWAVTNGLGYTDQPAATFVLSSMSSSFNSVATVGVGNSTQGAWFEANFSNMVPEDVPSDLTLTVYVTGASATGMTVTLDDIQMIFAEKPYLDNEGFASYVNNPEGMDGDTGQFGPDDTAKLMAFGIVRGTLCMLTSGGLHETTGSTTTEPSGWNIKPVQGNCGILSAFALAHSQARDNTEAGGDDWMAWASDQGAMIYGGGIAHKISQELQPNWSDETNADTSVQINFAAAQSVWALNDQIERLLMFGLPLGTAGSPSQIYVLNYQHLTSAEAIASSPPYHPSFAGKLIATDNSRKWTHWPRPMNGAARMYRGSGLVNVFFGGNSESLGSGQGFGHIYTLNPELLTDSDYGQIFPYYTTYFFLDPEKRVALGLKGGRILMAFVLAQIQPKLSDANSQVVLTYFGDQLTNAWPLATTRQLTQGFYKDRNFGGGMAQGERIAIRIASSPITGTDNSMVCTRLSAFVRNARILISGVNQ